MTGWKGHHGGSPPSQCPDRILDILQNNGALYISDIEVALNHDFKSRTINTHLRNLRNNGRIECIVGNGTHRPRYRVKKG